MGLQFILFSEKAALLFNIHLNVVIFSDIYQMKYGMEFQSMGTWFIL